MNNFTTFEIINKNYSNNNILANKYIGGESNVHR